MDDTYFRSRLRFVVVGIPLLSPVFSLSNTNWTNHHLSQEDSETHAGGQEITRDAKQTCDEQMPSVLHPSMKAKPKPAKAEYYVDLMDVTDLTEALLGVEAAETKSSCDLPSKLSSRSSRRRGPSSLPNVPTDLDKQYLSFPFLTQLKTVTYLQESGSKVLLIMRGLPGSGKSSIVKALTAVFDAKHITVCSADHFFYQPDGSYVFNEKLLSTAHSTCQHKCKDACQNGVPVVVVDNTNIRKWEMKFYLSQANISGYVVVLVEPKTPWKLDAEELAAKTTHGVSLEILQKKVNSFDSICPSYYGWFVNHRKSQCLTSLCSRLFVECVSKLPHLKVDLLRSLGVNGDRLDEATALGILARYFSAPGRYTELLHCTARFCGRGKVPGSSQYHQRSDVQSSCGQMYTLTITGILMTKKTLSVRVSLDAQCSTLFDRPEEKEWSSTGGSLGMSLSPRASKFGGYRGHSKKGSVLESPNTCSDLSGLKGRELKKAQRVLKRAKKEAKRKAKLEASDEEDPDDNSGKDTLDFSGNLDSSDSFNTSQAFGDKDDSGLSENQDSPDSFNTGHSFRDGFGESIDNSNSSLDESPCSSKPTVPLSNFFPHVKYSGFSRSAHLTVKTAQGIESRETNFDVLHVCDVERQHVYSSADFIELERGTAVYYGDGICAVYFEKPIKIHSLFSGYY